LEDSEFMLGVFLFLGHGETPFIIFDILSMKRCIIILALISLSLGASAQVKFFDGEYIEALAYAKEVNKPLFLDFYADWCIPCKQMERYSFSDREFSAIINEKYVAVKVNVDYFWGMDVAEKYRIKQYPTLLVVDNKGREKGRTIGFQTEQELKTFIRPHTK